jgi:hypothetical protein
LTLWSEYDFESDFERLAESVELLLFVAAAVSVVELEVLRLADLVLELAMLSDWSDEVVALSEADLSLDLLADASREADWLLDLLTEASREADLSLDLLAEASSEALDDLEAAAERLLSDDALLLAERSALPLRVLPEVPAVVLVPFDPEPPLLALRLSAVVPVEDE